MIVFVERNVHHGRVTGKIGGQILVFTITTFLNGKPNTKTIDTIAKGLTNITNWFSGSKPSCFWLS
jgi:hypothetical protein